MPSKSGAVIDRSELRKAEITECGFLRVPAIATRVGVFAYRTADGGVRRELRHPEDVFDEASLRTLRGVPVTNDHPNVIDPDVLLVTPENCRKFMVGLTGDEIEADDRFVLCTLTVTDAEAIAAINDGKQEVSCGYTRDLEDGPGVWEGLAYDYRQRNIRYNHFALVDRGRAGPEVRIRLDSADAVQVEPTIIEERSSMEKITLGGVEFDCSPEMKKAIEAALAEAGKAKADAVPEKKDGDGDKPDEKKTEELQAANDGLQAKVDGLTAELAKVKAAGHAAVDADVVKIAVKARLRLESVARRVLSKDDAKKVLDSDDLRAIKVAIVKAERPNAVLDGKSDAYLDASVDGIAEALDAADDNGAELGKSIANRRAAAAAADAKDAPDSDAARQRQKDRLTGAKTDAK